VLAGTDRPIFRLPPGRMIFGSVRPTVLLDLRDDPARPRSGLFLQLTGDYLRSYSSDTDQPAQLDAPKQIHVNLLRVQALAATYIPLPSLSSIMLSARGGRVYQLDPQSLTPGDRRFYLGGATSLRGFHEDAVQPQDLVDQLRAQVRACESTLSDIACTAQAQLLASGGTSDGGDVFIAFTAELRVPVSSSFETALFWDAGNLWRSPPRRFIA